jgi:hypothetical protein
MKFSRNKYITNTGIRFKHTGMTGVFSKVMKVKLHDRSFTRKYPGKLHDRRFSRKFNGRNRGFR